MTAHNYNLPWSVKQINGNDTETILDSTGMPVAFSLGYTSVKQRVSENEVYYHNSEYAGPIRARLIVDAVNARWTASKTAGRPE